MDSRPSILLAILALAACGTITGYSRDAEGIYPAGELNAPPTRFVGFRQRFYLDPARHWRFTLAPARTGP